MGYLIAYDIACPRRWRRIYRTVLRTGWRLQYSVFWADIGHAEARALAATLEQAIDPREDDVRLYFLPDATDVLLAGPRPWPKGVTHAAANRFDRFLRQDIP